MCWAPYRYTPAIHISILHRHVNPINVHRLRTNEMIQIFIHVIILYRDMRRQLPNDKFLISING